MSSIEKDIAVSTIEDWFAENGYTGNGVHRASGKVFIFTTKGKVIMPKVLAELYKSL